MLPKIYLLAFVIWLIIYTIYCIMTNDMTDEERDEMLNDEEMWP